MRQLDLFSKLIYPVAYPVKNKGGRIGDLVGWLIRVVIYDICVTSISEVFGVSRLVALFIFLAILALFSFGAYVLKQRLSPDVDE